jgi:hypothetical protein
MLEFESLGDNCEFGLLQRHWSVEPLGLLRLAAFNVPPAPRARKLAEALRRRFEGLGEPETIKHSFVDQAAPREIMIRETLYGLQSHSGLHEGQIEAGAVADREATRLRFLRRKLLEDLATGEKICVWKSTDGASLEDVLPLLEVLRELGPNRLLWVVDADESLGAGMVQRLDHDLVKGAVLAGPFREAAPPRDVEDTVWNPRRYTWIQVCQAAYEVFRGQPGARPTAA